MGQAEHEAQESTGGAGVVDSTLETAPLSRKARLLLPKMTLTETEEKIERAFATHTPMWQRFQADFAQASSKTSETLSNVYSRQYSHVYAQRLAMLKPRCWEAVPSEGVTRVSRVLDLREDSTCVVAGTIVKECESASDDPINPKSECRDSDVLFLEDESGRVMLATDGLHQWCTGVVVAVQGIVKDGGVMHVEKMYAPTAAPSLTIEGELKPPSHDNYLSPHIMLISGINAGDPNVCSLTRDMLLGYLEGQLTPNAAKICRVIVAGNSASSTAFGVQELDGWIALVCAAGIPVDLIPGQDDPTTANWPQRPFHSSLLKYSCSFLDKGLLSRTPNPFACGLGDKYVVGTDGRNVSDLQKYLANSQTTYTPLEALRESLRWQHICPTGPSSVPTVPHGETDPMVLVDTPHLYFAGNCKCFETDLVEQGDMKTRLVCVPKFAETGEVVLVNLDTLDCELVRFEDQV